jgi:hypothetical protein
VADITARNRSNAKNSTGPKTALGKAAGARNACRHGATSAPDQASVADWLKIILNTPEISHEHFTPGGGNGRLALELARAEAVLCRSEHAMTDFERGAAELWTRDPLAKADTYNGIFILLGLASSVLWDDPQSANARPEDDPYWLGPWHPNPIRDLGNHEQIEFMVSMKLREISLHPPHEGRRKAEAVMREIEILRTPKVMPWKDQHRLLKRYLGEAKTKRNKALNAWIESKSFGRAQVGW